MKARDASVIPEIKPRGSKKGRPAADDPTLLASVEQQLARLREHMGPDAMHLGPAIVKDTRDGLIKVYAQEGQCAAKHSPESIKELKAMADDLRAQRDSDPDGTLCWSRTRRTRKAQAAEEHREAQAADERREAQTKAKQHEREETKAARIREQEAKKAAKIRAQQERQARRVRVARRDAGVSSLDARERLDRLVQIVRLMLAGKRPSPRLSSGVGLTEAEVARLGRVKRSREGDMLHVWWDPEDLGRHNAAAGEAGAPAVPSVPGTSGDSPSGDAPAKRARRAKRHA